MSIKTINQLDDATLPLLGTDKILVSRDGANVRKAVLASLPLPLTTSQTSSTSLVGNDSSNNIILGNGLFGNSSINLNQFLTGINKTGTDDMAPAVNAAIQYAALNGISRVVYSGIVYIRTGIKARSGVVLSGDGFFSLTIKTISGFTGNVYENYNWSDLVTNKPTGYVDGCPIRFGLTDAIIIADNFTGSVTTETGYGVRLYGRQIQLERLLVTKTAGVGMYLTYNSTGAYVSGFNTTTDTKYSVIQNIEIMETGYEGFVFDGPTDAMLNNIYVGWPAGSRFNSYDSVGSKNSLLFPTETVSGARITASCEIGFLHSYNNNFGYAINVNPVNSTPVRLRAHMLMGESSYGGVYIGSNVRYAIGILESHNNIGGPTTSGTYSANAGVNPHINIQSTLGGCSSNVDIYRDGDEKGSVGLYVGGISNDLRGNIYAFKTTFLNSGIGIVNNSVGSDIKFNIASAKNAGVSLLSIGYQEESTASNNKVNIYSSSCATNINFVGGAGSENGSNYILKTNSAQTSEITNIARLGTYTYLGADILTNDGTNKRRNKFTGNTNFSFATTGLQTISIPYGNFLVKDPSVADVQATISYVSGTFAPIARFGVANIDTTNKNINVFVEATGGATGTGKISVRV